MGRIRKNRYIKSISVPQDINGFFDWLGKEGVERSDLITRSIREWSLYKTFFKGNRIQKTFSRRSMKKDRKEVEKIMKKDEETVLKEADAIANELGIYDEPFITAASRAKSSKQSTKLTLNLNNM